MMLHQVSTVPTLLNVYKTYQWVFKKLKGYQLAKSNKQLIPGKEFPLRFDNPLSAAKHIQAHNEF